MESKVLTVSLMKGNKFKAFCATVSLNIPALCNKMHLLKKKKNLKSLSVFIILLQ